MTWSVAHGSVLLPLLFYCLSKVTLMAFNLTVDSDQLEGVD